MTDAEWETVAGVLVAGKRWAEAWRVAQAAPARWSARLLQALALAQWVPEAETAEPGYRELVRLAQLCEGPGPVLARVHLADPLQGHTGGVRCVAMSPDGRILASGGQDRTVRLWQLPDGYALARLPGHAHCVESLAISPDGGVLASSSYGVVRLWRLPGGHALATLRGHTEEKGCLAITQDGAILASSSKDHTVRLWRLADGEPITTLHAHPYGVGSLAVSPDGRILAIGSYLGPVRLWRLPDGHALATLKGHTHTVWRLALSPDGRILAGASRNPGVRIWKIAALEELPIGQVSDDDLVGMRARLPANASVTSDRDWLGFIDALLRWRHRIAPGIDVSLPVSAGELDVQPDA